MWLYCDGVVGVDTDGIRVWIGVPVHAHGREVQLAQAGTAAGKADDGLGVCIPSHLAGAGAGVGVRG